MKKGVTPPSEVQQQVEDDAEVDAKESENPKTNEVSWFISIYKLIEFLNVSYTLCNFTYYLIKIEG